MKQIFLLAVSVLMVSAGSSFADSGADIFTKKCKTCHDTPGSGKTKLGPDLATSKMTEDQFVKQVMNGSEWAGRPAKMAGFEMKKMMPIKGITDADVKAVYKFAKGGK
ncbi:MAG: cytochrome c [Nitrospinae bacterium]|nr:cytochrome c [Nitrospinota bacterium]